MEHAICLLPVVALRREPNDRSEMLTQVLFGETARIFERTAKWVSVETDLDHYPGWIDARQLETLTEEEYFRLKDAPVFMTTAPFTSVEEIRQGTYLLPAGSRFPGMKNAIFKAGEREFSMAGKVAPFEAGPAGQVIATALRFLNAPYLWGGRTHMGIDCSGLTQVSFGLNGYNLLRDASQQAGEGTAVHLLSEAHPGDLAFFDNSDGKIVHVGIILDASTIIHASGQVRVDALDHQGIFRTETKTYSHQLRLIRRIID